MPATLAINDLLDYTDWERDKWLEWFRQQGTAMEITSGTHGDGRFDKAGEVVRHIFSAEKRYVDRLSGRPLTDTNKIPAGDIEALFQFGRQSRRDLRDFIEAFPAQEWDTPQEFKLLNWFLSATPRKIVAHILLHEIRHWAQMATLFRFNGLAVEFHDFLFSPVMGGEFRREQ